MADEPQAWQFEMSGEAARQELSGYMARRGLSRDVMEHDKRLMGRVARGDEAAFTELVGRYGGRLLGVARRLLGARADAEDAVQRAFLPCYLGAGTYPARGARAPAPYPILTNGLWADVP